MYFRDKSYYSQLSQKSLILLSLDIKNVNVYNIFIVFLEKLYKMSCLIGTSKMIAPGRHLQLSQYNSFRRGFDILGLIYALKYVQFDIARRVILLKLIRFIRDSVFYSSAKKAKICLLSYMDFQISGFFFSNLKLKDIYVTVSTLGRDFFRLTARNTLQWFS